MPFCHWRALCTYQFVLQVLGMWVVLHVLCMWSKYGNPVTLMAVFLILFPLVKSLNSNKSFLCCASIFCIGRCSDQCVNHSHSPKSTKQPRQIHVANTELQEAYTCTSTEGRNTFISTAISKWRWCTQGVCRSSIKRRRKRNREGNHLGYKSIP